ncbi:ExbD/TolR family protein [Fibrobacterota bacterium]
MAFKRRNKREKAKDLGLLPFMNLFAILIPFLLSVAVFEKLGILELNLPERSMIANPQDNQVDPMNLNLTVIITDEYLTVGAGGGFLPNYFYDEEIQYRSKSDGHVFFKKWVKGEEVKSPTDGRVMTPYEKEIIHLYYLDKKDSADDGEFVMVAANGLGEPVVDSIGDWYKRVPAPGERFQVVGDLSLRTMTARDNHLYRMKKLSVYDEVAKNLWKIHEQALKREEPPEDIDRLTILANSRIIYDKIIHVMDAAKYAGFSQLSLSLLGG